METTTSIEATYMQKYSNDPRFRFKCSEPAGLENENLGLSLLIFNKMLNRSWLKYLHARSKIDEQQETLEYKKTLSWLWSQYKERGKKDCAFRKGSKTQISVNRTLSVYLKKSANGLSVLDLETGLHSNVIKGSDMSAPHGLAVIGSTVYFSDSKSRQIKSFKYPLDEMEPDIQVYAGNGDAARRYRIATFASFGQPSSIVAEGKSLLVCDTGVNAVSLVSSVKSLYLACKNYGDLFDALGVHANTKYS